MAAGFEAPGSPALSVVVTIVEGGAAVPRILAALLAQGGAHELEILVPMDASLPDRGALEQRFPTVHFLDLGAIETARPVATAAGQHELYDRRRAAALAQARGSVIAILEDRGVPRSDWAATAIRLHATPHLVIGGAIECGPSRLTEWALYLCDFGRYALPFHAQSSAWVSDVNVTYRRDAIERTRSLWQERFHEPVVHDALRQHGDLLLSPELVVEHRRAPAPFGRLVAERFHWGRLYGAIRSDALVGLRRFAYVAASPLLPFVLLGRLAMGQASRRHPLRFVTAVPILLVFLGAWTIGEVAGTITRRP